MLLSVSSCSDDCSQLLVRHIKITILRVILSSPALPLSFPLRPSHSSLPFPSPLFLFCLSVSPPLLPLPRNPTGGWLTHDFSGIVFLDVSLISDVYKHLWGENGGVTPTNFLSRLEIQSRLKNSVLYHLITV